MKRLLCLTLVAVLVSSALHAQEPIATGGKPARVAFAQYCFWTGEMQLGQIDGVNRTEAGFFGGREVTLVEYDANRISLEELARQAKRAGVADRIHLPAGSQLSGTSIGGVSVGASLDGGYRSAPASDQKKQLEGTPYAQLKLTPEQATKVNAFARVNPAKAREWLTAPQREMLASAR